MLLGLTEPTSGTAWSTGSTPTRDPLRGEVPGRLHARRRRLLRGPDGAARTCATPPSSTGSRARSPSDRIDELLDDVGLADAADRKVGGYSRGMRQRLGLADALVKDPSILDPRRADGEHRPRGRARAAVDGRAAAHRAGRDGRAVVAPAPPGAAGVRPHRDLRRRAGWWRAARSTSWPPTLDDRWVFTVGVDRIADDPWRARRRARGVDGVDATEGRCGSSPPTTTSATSCTTPCVDGRRSTSRISAATAPTSTRSTTATSRRTDADARLTTQCPSTAASGRRRRHRQTALPRRVAHRRPQGVRRPRPLGAVRHPDRRSWRSPGWRRCTRRAAPIRDAADTASSTPSIFLYLFTLSPDRVPAFYEFIGILGPLLGIAFGFDAINGERSRARCRGWSPSRSTATRSSTASSSPASAPSRSASAA